jgi:hypothetical protein
MLIDRRLEMSTRTFIPTVLCGLLGPLVLVASFRINPAPPAEATAAQLADFANAHHDTIVAGGWMQGMGSLLIVLFALSLVHLAGATHRLAGWITLLAGGTILMVSLVEVTFYLAAVQAVAAGDAASGMASNNLIKAVQHVFLVAPALLLPLGVVLLGSRILPSPFAYSALALGATLQVLGLVGLFNVLQPVIDVVLIVQALWFMAASVALAVRKQGASEVQVERRLA